MAGELRANGRSLAPGTEVSIRGVSGRFAVHGVNADGSLSVYGGTDGRQSWRAFRIDRVKTVHRTRKLRGGEALHR